MSISATALLEAYLASEFEPDWCLATVVSKEGSSYRNPGAMMLVSPLGQASGMVSGGCLEMDVIQRSRQVLHDNCARFIEYDMIDEESLAAELGIGCRGKLGIYIQRIEQKLHNLMQRMYTELDAGRSCYMLQRYSVVTAGQQGALVLLDDQHKVLMSTKDVGVLPNIAAGKQHQLITSDAQNWSCAGITPAINIMIFGGGADARPLAKMAVTLGWRAYVIDHRPAYASERFFPEAYKIVREAPDKLKAFDARIDAAIVLTHNLRLDAACLNWVFSQTELPQYIGLLGPAERKYRVLENVTSIDHELALQHIRGPVGIDLGGELPESIALSILSDVHAVLMNGTRAQLYQQGSENFRNLKSG